jgi:protoporphyrinogen oxidase
LENRKVVIIGAGPAGLTAAYALQKAGVPSLVLEKDAHVGGHARTVRHDGFLFDIGGHRFFTKLPEVAAIWREVMAPGAFLRVRRLSRIFYRGRFYHYPLRPLEALRQLGFFESLWVVASYARKRLSPLPEEKTLEQWMVNRFGPRLFGMFFKSYTEKVWGLKCSEIGAEWAAQRIKSLTLWQAIRNALVGGETPRSLIDAFDYPERGPGMLWERMAERVAEGGQRVLLERPVARIRRDGFVVKSVTTRGPHGEEEHPGTHVIASMPLPELVRALDPSAPPEILAHARELTYRDFITVALMIPRTDVFPDNWIYVHQPEVLVGRIQNYKNWSAAMVPDAGQTCLGFEYFCNEGDAFWSLSDAEIASVARREYEALHFGPAAEASQVVVVRQEKAYPVYRGDYRRHLDALRDYLLSFANLQMVGRNGLHKYNNQDHAMLTALLAAKNVLGEHHDVWGVNTEDEYHESMPSRE